MSLGSLISEMLRSGNQGMSLSREESEKVIDEFVEDVAGSINDYRQEHRISTEEMKLITFR